MCDKKLFKNLIDSLVSQWTNIKRDHKIKEPLLAWLIFFYHSIIITVSRDFLPFLKMCSMNWNADLRIGLHFRWFIIVHQHIYADTKSQIALHSCCANAGSHNAQYVQWTLNHFHSFDVRHSIVCEPLLFVCCFVQTHLIWSFAINFHFDCFFAYMISLIV